MPGPNSNHPTREDEAFSPLVRTILRSFRAADEVAMRALRGAGFRGTGPAAWYLLSAVPEAGGRASALARELGVTKQAVGQALKELVREGYVTKEPDPDDRRALRVRPTPEGQEVARAGRAALETLEGRWAEELGRTRLKALRATMEEFCDFLEAEAASGD
jgi:DNA-binding MarR family transcriptional regulator